MRPLLCFSRARLRPGLLRLGRIRRWLPGCLAGCRENPAAAPWSTWPGTARLLLNEICVSRAWPTRHWTRPAATRLVLPRAARSARPSAPSPARCCGRSRAQLVAERAGLKLGNRPMPGSTGITAATGASRDAVVGAMGSVDRVPGVEPRSAGLLAGRSKATEIARRCLGGTVTVVSHDAVNRQVLAAFDARLGDLAGSSAGQRHASTLTGAARRRHGLSLASTNCLTRSGYTPCYLPGCLSRWVRARAHRAARRVADEQRRAAAACPARGALACRRCRRKARAAGRVPLTSCL